MWVVYIVRLRDNSLYTGITNDLFKRLKTHKQGKGSKYVRSRLPVKELFYVEFADTKSEALKREAKIKKLRKKQKEALTWPTYPDSREKLLSELFEFLKNFVKKDKI